MELFTHCFHEHYETPAGFSHDQYTDRDDALQPDPSKDNYNANIKIPAMRRYLLEMAHVY